MIELPYGIADFHRIRRQGFVYVDRTAHIRDLERLGSAPGMEEEELAALPAVAKALTEARRQAERYRRALARRHGTELDLRCYVVVAVGLERILGEEIERLS